MSPPERIAFAIVVEWRWIRKEGRAGGPTFYRGEHGAPNATGPPGVGFLHFFVVEEVSGKRLALASRCAAVHGRPAIAAAQSAKRERIAAAG
jgi:hypothetical protein